MTYVVREVLIKVRKTWLRYHPKVQRDNPRENAEEKNKEDATFKKMNKNSYNDLVLAQDNTTCF